MEARNGYHRDDYPTLQRKLREARARQRLARLEAETHLLEGFGAEPGLGFPTSWFDPFDLARFGWGVGGAAAGGAWNAGSRAARQDGGNHPFFWTETDLERSRGLARWLATRNLWATATLNDLTNYAIKLGFTYEAQPKKRWATDEVVKELALLVQDVVDDFAEQNRAPQVEREAFWWSRPDGECIYRFFDQRDGSTLIRPVLPEQLRQPLGSPPECSYGIETDPQDILSLRAFYVDYHGNSPDQYAESDFEEIPADEIAYLKLNVHSTVKRGLSDFFCCAPAFDELDKLLRNMRITAGVQSAVAHYERFTNLTSDALADFKAKRKDLNRPQLQHPISGRTLDMEHHEAGQVRLINGNREFIPPPLAQNTTNHISILQAATRTLGRRWSMPEYMASGDASNANYSSTLVAGSPFVNEIECEQDRYRTYFLDWRWIAIRNAARAGVFTVGTRRFWFEEIRRLVDLHATPPQVAIANKQAEAAVDHQDLAARVTSLQALRAKRGYDNDKIRQDLAEEPPTAVAGRVTDVDPQGNPQGKGQQSVRESLLECDEGANKGKPGPCPQGGPTASAALGVTAPYSTPIHAQVEKTLGVAKQRVEAAGGDSLKAGAIRLSTAEQLERGVHNRVFSLLKEFKAQYPGLEKTREFHEALRAGRELKGVAWVLGHTLGTSEAANIEAEYKEKLLDFQGKIAGLARAARQG